MKLTPWRGTRGSHFWTLTRSQIAEKKWSGREDLNLRPPGPEPCNHKLQALYLVSLRGQKSILPLAQLYLKLYLGPKNRRRLSERVQHRLLVSGKTMWPCGPLIKSHGSQFGCGVVNCSRHNNLTI